MLYSSSLDEYDTKFAKRILAKVSEPIVREFNNQKFVCRLWLGNKDYTYGYVNYLEQNCAVHRAMKFIATGQWPKILINICGNRLCCEHTHWIEKDSKIKIPKEDRYCKSCKNLKPIYAKELCRLCYKKDYYTKNKEKYKRSKKNSDEHIILFYKKVLSKISEPVVRRFNNREYICNEWTGSFAKQGYGIIRYRRKTYFAHKIAWFIENQKWPDNLKNICHNRKCCNPQHWIEKSQQ